MDKLLWEAMTNLLSVVMTQTSFIMDAADAGQEGAAEAVATRIHLFRQIANEINALCDEFENGTRGVNPHDVDAMFKDFGDFLGGLGS